MRPGEMYKTTGNRSVFKKLHVVACLGDEGTALSNLSLPSRREWRKTLG